MTTRILRVRDDGTVDGLTVVGYHGAMDADSTPDARSPIYVCGRRFAEVGDAIAPDAKHGRRVAVLLGGPSTARSVADGDFAGLPARPARLGFGFVAIGVDENEHLEAIEHDAASCAQSEAIEELLRVLRTPGAKRPASSNVVFVDKLVIWYCSSDDAIAWYGIVAAAARRLLLASRADDLEQRTRLSWWLWNSASTDADIALAAAAIEPSDAEAARIMRRDGLGHLDPAQLRAESGRAALALCVPSEADAPAPTNVFAAARDRMRAPYLDWRAANGRAKAA